jgi:hypothetical protein
MVAATDSRKPLGPENGDPSGLLHATHRPPVVGAAWIRSLGLVAMLALAAGTGLTACSGDEPTQDTGGPDNSCTTDNDCKRSEVCFQNECVNPLSLSCVGCEANADCAVGNECYLGCCITPAQRCGEGLAVCAGTCTCDSAEGLCKTPEKVPCNSEGNPVDLEKPPLPTTCASDLDCGTGAFCLENKCYTGSGQSCERDSQCPPPENCLNGERCGLGDGVGDDTGGETTAGTGKLRANPDAIDFGSIVIGRQVSRTVKLTNTGTGVLIITGIKFSQATDPGVFTFTPDPPLDKPTALDVGESFNFTVIYDPNDATPDVGTIEIENDGEDGRLDLPIGSQVKGESDLTLVEPGSSGAEVIFPRGDITRLKFDFGFRDLNQSNETRFAIRNTGSGEAVLAINSFEIIQQGAKDDTDQFAILVKDRNGQDLPAGEPLFLNSGEESLAVVTYKASRKGFMNAALRLVTNDNDLNNDGQKNDATLEIDLAGAAGIIPPGLVVNPNPVDFGIVSIGDTVTQTLTLTNTSPDVAISGLTLAFAIGTPEFDLATPLPQTIPASGTAQVTVTFTPQDVGRSDNTLNLSFTSFKDGPLPVPVFGRGGNEDLIISPALSANNDIYLGSALPGGRTPLKTIFIRNGGIEDVTIDLTRKQPSNFAEIEIIDNNAYPITLAPNQEYSIQARGLPSALGEFRASIEILHPGFGFGQTTFEVYAEGAPCADGTYDIDGDPLNGCEYTCTFVSAEDEPDDAFNDKNCDGIPGDKTKAVFLSPRGNDGNDGSIAFPKRSLAAAISTAAATDSKRAVYIAQGDYVERETIGITEGVNIYGGYSIDFSQRGTRTNQSFDAFVSGLSVAATATGIAVPTILDNFAIIASNTREPGASSIALLVQNSPGLILRNMLFKSGTGGDGQTGQDNSVFRGERGGDGQRGEDACDGALLDQLFGQQCGVKRGASPSVSTCGVRGGAGGDGGARRAAGDPGAIGTPSTPGGGGGIAGANNRLGTGGGNGFSGSTGGTGGPGSPGTGAGTFVGSEFKPAFGGIGETGQPGAAGGGGGGGGSGCCDDFIQCALSFCLGEDTGAGGGSGGAGGCGGPGGGGGGGGGGSFALVVADTPVTIESCEFTAGRGGKGGTGGTGGPGGPGGQGGSGGSQAKGGRGGGEGGDGGEGGTGGQGGGGAGGPAIGLVLVGAATGTSITTPVFHLGVGGAGGDPNGTAGVALESQTY